ncbi:hypothetical protein EYS09_20245 [Streptomyces kasugaensis]|uniref:Uncharacterized protein n=1 Tax=Streptomyces kasugaensis TaxID=1946 RepID=A0A4Q9HSC3_STRKA|nr:hypothetical protein [Streptomyces kasugaensis]TBO57907.1 hypothetical protein EYS09_20245 [Streptomyces kasugaensis]
MSTGHWDHEDDAPWHMRASAEDEGRVYQAGRDQHITEFHFHGSPPDVDDDDDEDEDDDWGYYETGGSSWGGIWETLLSVLLALAPLLPLAIAGASTRAVWTDKSDPSTWWSVLYSLGAVIVGATCFIVLRERLSYRSHLIDRFSWLYVPVSLGVFAYYIIGDPAGLQLKFIGDIGLECARKLGPL